VLLNLLSNAVKFTERGAITVSAGVVDEVGADGLLGRFLVIRVADTGIGIPSERQAEVFQEFVQIRGKHSRIAGTGLGLAISRKLVEAQQGRIWVESTPGAGSIFSFTLPIVGNKEAGPGVRGEAEQPDAQGQLRERAAQNGNGQNGAPLAQPAAVQSVKVES
jgi:signal transduction histidine kinase